jgi:iron(III) transport system substrate-binding protein
VVIGPPIPAHRETLARFQEAYPKIQLKLSGMISTEWEARVTAERRANVYAQDVLISGTSAPTYDNQIPAGWFASLKDIIRPETAKDELWLGGFDANFFDKAKKHVFAMQVTHTRSHHVHRGLIAEKDLNSFQDLMKPQWKGKIAMFDPRVRGPGGTPFTQLMLALGKDNTTAFLKQQQPVAVTNPRQLTEWVVRGRYPIVIGGNETEILRYREQGLANEVKALPIPREYLSLSPQWGGLLAFNNAPHPNAAKVFVNWVLSKEALSDWAKRAGVNTTRLDAELGNPDDKVDAETWQKGLKLNSEASAHYVVEAAALAKAGLE